MELHYVENVINQLPKFKRIPMKDFKIVGLMIVKKDSRRLKDKNWMDFKGKPMFQWNLEKCLRIFEKVYISSDYDFILDRALDLGAVPIKRPLELCREGVPSVPVFKHAYSKMMVKPNIIISVQGNSPTIKERLIKEAKELMERGYDELMTCHPDFTIYGSIWGVNSYRLEYYEEICGDFYNHKPDVLLVDPSINIHTLGDFKKAYE